MDFKEKRKFKNRWEEYRFGDWRKGSGKTFVTLETEIPEQPEKPIVAPDDIKRYFISPEESGELCLLSALFGENRDVFFPKIKNDFKLTTFSKIAIKYLKYQGYEPFLCESEDEARELIKTMPPNGKWPCLFQSSDTTGEKAYEEFYTEDETLDFEAFNNVGIIKNSLNYNNDIINDFEKSIQSMKSNNNWNKESIVKLFIETIPNFTHVEMGKSLDNKM
jgi:FlaA1/EpsC-like NDP-sugar epimerase